MSAEEEPCNMTPIFSLSMGLDGGLPHTYEQLVPSLKEASSAEFENKDTQDFTIHTTEEFTILEGKKGFSSVQELCSALKLHQKHGGILVTSLEQLESLDNEPIAMNLPKLSVAVLGMDKLMAISPETYCDPVETCNSKAAEVTKRVMKCIGLGSIAVFLIDSNDIYSYHFPDLLRVVRGQPVRKRGGLIDLTLRVQLVEQIYVSSLLEASLGKIKKMKNIPGDMKKNGVDVRDFVGMTIQDFKKHFQLKGIQATKLVKVQKVLKPKITSLESAQIWLWDRFEVSSYFAAKGENLAEVTEILKDLELDGQELLAEEVENMFQEILDETSHAEDTDSLQNYLCWNTWNRFKKLKETAQAEKEEIEEEVLPAEPTARPENTPEAVDISHQRGSISECANPGAISTTTTELPKEEEREAVAKAQKAVIQRVKGIDLQLTDEKPSHLMKTALRGVHYDQKAGKYRVCFQDKNCWATGTRGYAQPIQAARVMNLLLEGAENVNRNQDIGLHLEVTWSQQIPITTESFDERAREEMFRLLSSMHTAGKDTFDRNDLQIFFEMLLASSDTLIGDAIGMILKAHETDTVSKETFSKFLCALHLVFRLNEEASDLTPDQLHHFAIAFKELTKKQLVLDRNISKLDVFGLIAGHVEADTLEKVKYFKFDGRVSHKHTANKEGRIISQELTEEEMAVIRRPSQHIFRGFYPLLQIDADFEKDRSLFEYVSGIAHYRKQEFQSAVKSWLEMKRGSNFQKEGEAFFKAQVYIILDKFEDFVSHLKSNQHILNTQDKKGNTLMHVCSLYGRENIGLWLLNHSDTKQWFKPNSEGLTSLHLSSIFGYGNIVESLLLAKCPPDDFLTLDDKYKYDALYIAVFMKRAGIVSKFVQLPQLETPNDQTLPMVKEYSKCGQQFWTALHLAVDREDISVVKEILKNCDVNQRSPDGKTAFARAVEKNNRKLIRSFYERMEPRPHNQDDKPLWADTKTGVNVNTQDNEGMTPLMHAAKHNEADIVRELLYFRGDPTLVDKSETPKTAKDFVRDAHGEVVQTLEDSTDPEFRNNIFYRIILRKGITLFEDRRCQGPQTDENTLVKTSVVEVLYREDSKAHCKFYGSFGWISLGSSAEMKQPLYRVDANLLTFERFLERESAHTPKKHQTMKYWNELREKYIRLYNHRGLPQPPHLPKEAGEIATKMLAKELPSPYEEYILTEKAKAALGITSPEENRIKFESRPKFREDKTKDTKKEMFVFFRKERSEVELIMVSARHEAPIRVLAKNKDAMESTVYAKLNQYVNRDTIIITWDIKAFLDIFERQHDRCIDVNELFKNYRPKDVQARGHTRLDLREPAALILSERLPENALVDQHLTIIKKLMSLHLNTHNVEAERDEIRKNEPDESEIANVGGWRSKQELIDAKCKAIRKAYASKMNVNRQELLTGKCVVRVHVKKVEHLKSIEGALEALQDGSNPKGIGEDIEIKRMSIAVSMKTKSQKKGFFVYLELLSDADADKTIRFFQDMNSPPFKAEHAVAKTDAGSKSKSSHTTARHDASSKTYASSKTSKKFPFNKNATPFASSSTDKGYRGGAVYGHVRQGYGDYGGATNFGHHPMPSNPYGRYRRDWKHEEARHPAELAQEARVYRRPEIAIQHYRDAILHYPNDPKNANWHFEIAEILVMDLDHYDRDGRPSPTAQEHIDIALHKNPDYKRLVDKMLDVIKSNKVPTPMARGGFNRAPGPYHGDHKSMYGSESSYATHSTERTERSTLYSAADMKYDGKAPVSIRKAPGPYNPSDLKTQDTFPSMDVKADPAYASFTDHSADMPSFTGNDDYTNYMSSNLFSHPFQNSDHSYFTDQGNPRK